MFEDVKAVFDFIDGAIQCYESVLVHSLRGMNRAPFLLTSYLMQKYKWSSSKAIEYFKSKKTNLDMKNSFYSMLLTLEKDLRR